MSAISARREFAKGVFDRAIRKVLDATYGKTLRAFVQLLWNVQGRSELLRPGRAIGRVADEPVDRIVLGLRALVEHRYEWLRPAEHWEPSGEGPTALFASLAHHLLANYPTPPVLLSAWFRGTDCHAHRLQRWFRHVGQGGSFRTAGLPLSLTRRMAHEFAHAPAAMPIEFALRWAQVRGLGGSGRLARAVAATRLGSELVGDDFWVSVIHLFLNTPRLDLEFVGPIVEYLHAQKFTYQKAILGEDSEVYLEPPQPDLTVKGRTVASLSRQAEEWRARQADTPQRRYFRWDRSAIAEYRRDDADGRSWTIRELLDSGQLAAEGKAMRHCVATYAEDCLKGRSTIWTLGLEDPDGRRRLATIEVDPQSREVVQAKARDNDGPDEPSRAILLEWAAREGLNLENCYY
jgi:hypothetical protein